VQSVTDPRSTPQPGNKPVVPRIPGSGADLRVRWQELDLLRPIELARKLGYRTAEPVYDAIRRGELEAHVRRDGAYLIALAEALRYIESLRATAPTTDGPERPTRKSAPRPRRRTEQMQLAPRRVAR
jgi:hypothetical protein